MNRKFLKTKEFKIKFVASIFLLVAFALSFIFEKKLQKIFGLVETFSENEVTIQQVNSGEFCVSYLAVGQGSCSIIELPDDKTLIIDGGSDVNGEKIYKFLKDKNINKIDYMIASHADVDHIGGLNYLFDKFEIENIFRPMQIAGTNIEESVSDGTTKTSFEVFEYEDLKEAYEIFGKSKFVEATSYRYREFIKNIYNETYVADGQIKESKVTVFYDGLKIVGDDYEFEFFAPLKAEETVDFINFSDKTNGFLTKIYSNDSSNNSSAIVLCNIKNKKFLFCGDATAAIEEDDKISKFEESDFVESLTFSERNLFLSIDVYLASHHGSKYSSGFELLDMIKPKFVVFSYGKNTYGHPNNEVIERIESVNSLEKDGILKTKEHGTISFGLIDDEIVFATEIKDNSLNLLLPYLYFALIILLFLLLVIWNIRPLKIFDRKKW